MSQSMKRNPDSGNREIFAVESGILGFGIQNTAKKIWNPTKDWNPVAGESGIHGMESRIQDCLGFRCMTQNVSQTRPDGKKADSLSV